MILVVGATGVLGGMATRRLLQQGKDVRALVRDRAGAEPLAAAGAELVLGDLKDPESLRAATDGVETVVTTANSSMRGGQDTVETVDRSGNAALIDAAASTRVQRFVFMSALGADPASPVPFMRAKGETEERLRASGMSWTVLQPNLFMDVWIPAVVGGPALAGQPVHLVGESQRRHSFIAMDDVAAYLSAAVDHESATNRRLVLGGPEALTWWDVVREVERALGREVVVRTVTPGDDVPGLPPAMSALITAMETYDSPVEMEETSRTFGVPPTSVRAFVSRFVASAAPPGA